MSNRLIAGGNSGGPVWIRNNAGEFVAVGIHIAQGRPNTLGVARTIDAEVILFAQNFGYSSN